MYDLNAIKSTLIINTLPFLINYVGLRNCNFIKTRRLKKINDKKFPEELTNSYTERTE